VFHDWHRDLRDQKEERLKALAREGLTPPGKALRILEIEKEFLALAIRERIAIYKRVCDQFESPEMLLPPRIDQFRCKVMTTVGHALLARRGDIHRYFREVGYEGEALGFIHYQSVASHMLDIVNSKLKVLETAAVPSTGGPLQVQPIATTLNAVLDGATCLDGVIAALPALTPDLKNRKKLEAVANYRWYFSELTQVKAKTKKYQTPQSLKALYPDFALWKVLEHADLNDIATGQFDPGRFAWSLVQRIQGRRSVDDRTLRNYERSLRRAKLLT